MLHSVLCLTFICQIDALLPNVRPKPSRIAPLEHFLHTLHGFLMNLPPVSPQHPLDGSRRLLKKKVAVPYSLPLPTEDTKWKVGFEKPSDITLVGSWANKVSVKANDHIPFGVDLAVEMPNVSRPPLTFSPELMYFARPFFKRKITSMAVSSKNEHFIFRQ